MLVKIWEIHLCKTSMFSEVNDQGQRPFKIVTFVLDTFNTNK